MPGDFKKNLFFSFLFVALCPLPPATAETARQAMVVTAHPAASRAALEILKQGGNAVDAACAAQWVLNVVEPQSSGIGGGGFFIYYEAATRRVYAFDGREKAPLKAYPEMFLDGAGQPYPFYPDRITGGLAVGVPGTLKLLHEVHSRFGSGVFPFGRLFDPAIRLASEGFRISPRLARFLQQEKERLKLFEATRALFLDEEGKPHAVGTLLRQPDLAKTFRLIQEHGIDIFYEGEIAEAIVNTVRYAPFHPGLMELQDLASYQVKERPPVSGTYRGYQIFSMGPPSSGATTLIEALNLLEFYDLALHGRNANGVHLLSEVQRLAFQDRNLYLGDPDAVSVPVEMLVSKEYAKNRIRNFNFNQTVPEDTAPLPATHAGTQTSHISIADAEGNLVSFTTTIESVFGSGMVVPGYGFFLNNELTDFDAVPYDPTGRLVPNAPGPQKRPRSSMTPTLVFKEGTPYLVIGSPGGSRIIGVVFNVIVNILDFGMSLSDALRTPRVINRNGALELEPPLSEDSVLVRELESRGHTIEDVGYVGNVQAILIEPQGPTLIGESDPRGEGKAMGV